MMTRNKESHGVEVVEEDETGLASMSWPIWGREARLIGRAWSILRL
jgi:hypothetical protein